MKKKVVVIGSGLGGLSVASYLAKYGFDVTVLEKNNQPGGRAMKWEKNGYKFDLGPSWYWTPQIFDKFFSDFGYKTSDFYQLKKLNPSYRIFWNKNDIDNISSDLNEIKEIFEKYQKGSFEKLKKILEEGKFMLDLALNKFLYREYKSILDLFNFQLIFNALKLKVLQSYQSVIDRNFMNDRLKKMTTWQSLFLGSTPQLLPALYIFMLYIDFVLGTWYPQGGIYQLPNAIYKMASNLGVKFIFNKPVNSIEIKNNLVIGVKTQDSDFFQADFVVANADYFFVEQNLLPEKYRSYSLSYWNNRKVSPSALLYYFGVEKKIKNIIHHNYYFNTETWNQHMNSLFSNPDWPGDFPSIYFSATSKTDNTAPEGCENLFILIPVSSGLDDTEEVRKKYRDYVISKIEELTEENFGKNIVVERVISHRDQQDLYNSFKGSCFGLAQTLFQSLNFRPKNRSKKLKNLFYVGHFTHPGISMPMTIISGEVVANIIKNIKY